MCRQLRLMTPLDSPPLQGVLSRSMPGGHAPPGSQEHRAGVPFFPEVHEELTKMWGAPYTACPRQGSSLLTTLDGGAARGVRLRCIFARKTPPPGGIVRASHPKPVSFCQLWLRGLMVLRVGHAMAILQVYQAKALKQLHEGSSDSEVMQELRSATDFASSKVMSTMVVQERHLWLNLAQMLAFFGDTVEDFAQQFSAVQKQTETIKHILPRRDKASGARPLPAASTPAPPPATSQGASPQQGHRANRRKTAQAAAQALQSDPDTGNLEMEEVVLQVVSTTPPPPPGEGRRMVSSQLPLTHGSVVPTYSKKEQFPLSPGPVPQVRFLSDAQPPQLPARSLKSSTRDPGQQ
ncbi:hypothetical protein M9458_023663, partial [Cirrhinus mrigala]